MSTAAVQPAPSRGDTAAPRRAAQMGAYALVQLRDYVIDRGLPTILICLLLTYVILWPLRALANLELTTHAAQVTAQYGSMEAARAALARELTSTFLNRALGNIIFLGTLFAMNGIVANDRKLGYFRFLFAKPVTPTRYYGQAFLIHWVGFMGLMMLLGAVYSAVVSPVLTGPLLITLALMFLCYAGITFALSAAARWDWLSLVAVTVAATVLWMRYGRSTSPIARLVYLLPPLHRTSEIYAAVASGEALPWPLLAWLAGYGAAPFAIGLVVLRFRRLAII